MNQPSPEEVEYQRKLLEEFRNIVADKPRTVLKPMGDRQRVHSQLEDIRSEMIEFLRKCPN